MKIIKYIIGIAVIIATSCSTPLTDEQKNSDSVLLKQIHEYTLNDDGSVDYRYYHKRLYNTYLSFHRLYGETFVVYNPEFQTLNVNKSETTMANGKKVKSPENAFNEVLPFQAADAPAYNYLREMVITHVGLEIGSIVELDYSIHSKADFNSIFSEKILLNESSPVKDLKIIARVPKGKTLNHIVVNQIADMKFSKKASGDFDVYTWTATNLRARSNEQHQVEGMVDYQTLVFSNADLSSAMDFFKNKLNKEFVLQGAMEKLLLSKSKDWMLAEEIENHICNNINTYRVLPQTVVYNFRSPAEVWQSNGGTVGEKTILLAALLKQAGFNAEMALGAYPQYLSKDVGCPNAFDKYIVRVELNGETRYLKVSDDHTVIPGSRIFIGLNDDLSSLNLEPIQKPNLKLEMKSDFEISKDGIISGTSTLKFNPFDTKKGLIGSIPENSFTSKELPAEDDFTVYSIKLDKGITAEKTGDYFSFSLPCLKQGILSAGLSELPSNRQTQLELPGAFEETYEFFIKYPKGFKIVSPAYSEKIENSFGSAVISFEITDVEVIIRRKLILNRGIVPDESYKDFIAIFNIWMDKNLNRIILKAE